MSIFSMASSNEHPEAIVSRNGYRFTITISMHSYPRSVKTSISVSLLAKMITKTLKIIALGMINRIFGGIFGLLKWCVILSSLVLVSQEINEIITLIPDKTLKDSVSYNLLDKLGGFLFDWVMQSKTVQVKQFI